MAMIHYGSRGLGHQVCSDHVRDLDARYTSRDGMWVDDEWDYVLPDRQLAAAPFYSKEGQSYFDAMNAAANFAFANRSALAHRLREVLKLELGVDGEARLLFDVLSITSLVLSARVASTEKVQHEPLLETIAKSRKATPTVANQCWSQAIWGPVHGSCLDPNRAQIKPLVHLATGQAGHCRGQRPRKQLMGRRSNSN